MLITIFYLCLVCHYCYFYFLFSYCFVINLLVILNIITNILCRCRYANLFDFMVGNLFFYFLSQQVVVQYDKDLLEVWDEAKRLRCEWFNDYEKTASKPPMVIADLDVIQLDFRGKLDAENLLTTWHKKKMCFIGDNVDCWMEIQSGKGPWAPPVSGIVPLGSTLTLVVAINDFRGNFNFHCLFYYNVFKFFKLSCFLMTFLRTHAVNQQYMTNK